VKLLPFWRGGGGKHIMLRGGKKRGRSIYMDGKKGKNPFPYKGRDSPLGKRRSWFGARGGRSFCTPEKGGVSFHDRGTSAKGGGKSGGSGKERFSQKRGKPL